MSEATGMTLLRLRADLAAGGLPTAERQIEWADACAAAGLPASARPLYEIGFLRAGMAASQRRRWSAIAAARTGALARADVEPPASVPPGRTTIAIALDELRAFAAAMAPRFAAVLSVADREREADTLPHQARNATVRVPRAAPPPIETDIAALWGMMSAPAPADRAAADDLVAAIAAAVARPVPIDWRIFAGADLAMLAGTLSVAGLRHFFAVHRDIAGGIFGSAELLWRVARFDSAGLGPYFRNVGGLVRKAADLRELASVAEQAATDAGVEGLGASPWLYLLGRDLPRPLLLELIDDLGDRGDMAALALLCARLAGDELVDVELMMRVRDAAIDHRDDALAARAQARLVELFPGSSTEMSLLGSLNAMAGRVVVAEQCFVASLALDPENLDAAARLAALRQRRFDAYRIEFGFTTPIDRQLTRRSARKGKRGFVPERVRGPVAVEFR